MGLICRHGINWLTGRRFVRSPGGLGWWYPGEEG